MVVLDEAVVNSGRGKGFRPIGFHEEPARVLVDRGLEDKNSGKRGLDDFHSGLL